MIEGRERAPEIKPFGFLGYLNCVDRALSTSDLETCRFKPSLGDACSATRAPTVGATLHVFKRGRTPQNHRRLRHLPRQTSQIC